MPDLHSHPSVLFSLCPGNELAEKAVEHGLNCLRASTLSNGTRALVVGLPFPGKSSTTLATLGRGEDADIYIEGESISRLQCSFEMVLDFGVIMFNDLSRGSTTQIGDSDAMAMPFEPGRARKVLVQHDLNTIIEMGRKPGDLVKFKLVWHKGPKETAEMIEFYKNATASQVKNPRLALTLEVEDPGLRVRYVRGEKLGSGRYGTVYKATNVDSGRNMAVKILNRPLNQRELLVLQREVQFLCQARHVSDPPLVPYRHEPNVDASHILSIFSHRRTGMGRT